MVDIAGLIDELTAIVGAEFIQTSPLVDTYRLDERMPWAVVTPQNLEEVAAVLALAHREALAVIPWGGGTTMAMGQAVQRIDIALCLHRLNRVLEHEPADLTVIAQAGITMHELQSRLGSRGQWWPVNPPCSDRATLGGVLATNSSGPKRLLYGTARDLLIGIKIAHADGSISKAGGKVTKNVTGYDMMKLYIGSLGTLGVIVEATLKLRPVPPVQQLAWATFPASEDAAQAAQQLLNSYLLPNAVELLNPAASSRLARDLPGLHVQGWVLLVGIDGAQHAVTRQLRDLQELWRQTGGTAGQAAADDGGVWQALQSRYRPQGPDRLERVVIRVGTARMEALAALNSLVQLDMVSPGAVEVCARLGNGLVYASLPIDAEAAHVSHLARALGDLRARLMGRRGYLVVESAPLFFKAQFESWGDLGPQVAVMQGLKEEFDPRRVLNPGRFAAAL